MFFFKLSNCIKKGQSVTCKQKISTNESEVDKMQNLRASFKNKNLSP